MGTHTCQEDAQHMTRDFHNVARLTILKKYAKVRPDRSPEVTIDGMLLMKREMLQHRRLM